jgi:ATP-dependent helicase/nuclease subunit A
VVDLLAYLRLLQKRYDDEALVTVLASPFVGVSNDALVLLRRAAGRRPLYAGIERGLPEDMDERDLRLFRAFRQRYERLAEGASGLSLERLCEQVVIEHDYDLAVLAQADGRRRYANMRKLGRLARSYEELRGRDIEGFVRFVREQDSVGATELEAVAEEEDTDVIRLLTIHAAKGSSSRSSWSQMQAVTRAPHATKCSACRTAASASRSRTRPPENACRAPATTRSRRPRRRPSGTSGAACTTWR